MGAQGPPAAERTIRLLDYDPDLAASLRRERLAEARASAQAPLVEVPRGSCTAEQLTGGQAAAYGVLLLDGLLNRTVVLDGVVSAQLLGRGDLLRVSGAPREALIATSFHWTVLEPLAVAVLDEQFLMSVRRWPEIVAALFERVAAQEERREIHRALSQLPRVEDRVHALMWLLAERWGRMTREGVVLRLRLTHELLGQLVGAKRPTVSLALKELESRGSVRRRSDGGWLLRQAWTAEPGGVRPHGGDGAGLVPETSRLPPPHRLAPPASSTQEGKRGLDRIGRLHQRIRDEVSGVARGRGRRDGDGASPPGT